MKIFFLIVLATTIAAVGPTYPQQPSGAEDVPATVELASERVVVPMELYANKPVIEVTINGKGPFSLFLDTGAGGAFLDKSLADELKLPSAGTMKIGDPADPNAIEAKRGHIGELKIGGAFFRNFVAVSSDRSGLYREGSPRGVLGIPLFRNVLVTIDYPNKQLIIAKGSLPEADGKRILKMKHEDGGVYSVPISINGKPMDAHIDSGSAGAITMPAELMDKLPLAAKPVERGRARTVAGDMAIYGANLSGDLALGDFALRDPEIVFFGRLRTANLGYGILSKFAITLDQSNLLFRFAGTGTTSAPGPMPAGLSEYVGTYGVRAITAEGGSLYLQRLSGPRGAGPKIKLIQVRPGEFAFEGQTEVHVKFDGRGAMSVLSPDGLWETAKRN